MALLLGGELSDSIEALVPVYTPANVSEAKARLEDAAGQMQAYRYPAIDADLGPAVVIHSDRYLIGLVN